MNQFRRAQGYILIEVVIAMAIFMAMVVYGLYLQNLSYRTEQGKRVGQQYASINAAVGNYMVAHYSALEKLRVECSKTTFVVGSSDSFNPARVCGLQISNTVSIKNGMQPTVQELIAAGYLPPVRPSVTAGVPAFPMKMIVAEANPNTGAESTTLAKARLFINIDRVCLATHSADPSSVSAPQAPDPTTGVCAPETTTSLTSLVFNTQPYKFDSSTNFGFVNRMDGIWKEIGADVAMSHPLQGGELNGANMQVKNPVREEIIFKPMVIGVTYVQVGIPGIVAVRNGYGANYANSHSRVDGSNPPTSDWSFANNSIKDVNKLTVVSVDADAVVAKVVDSEVLKLGDRTEGAACNASQENVSFGNGTILMCNSGKWTPLGAKGTVNGLDYYEFELNKYSGQSITISRTHCPKSGCSEGYAFSNGGSSFLSTTLKKDEWLPVLVRFRDQPYGWSGLGFLTQSDYGFQVDGLGNYTFMFDTGTGLAAQVFNSYIVNIVIRFYRINP